MKKNEETDPGWIVYPGPHPALTFKGVPELGEIHLERGKPVQVPQRVAIWLIEQKKVVGAAAPKPAEPEAIAAAEENSEGRASIAVMVTNAMVEELESLGFTTEQINAMTPQEAHDAIAAGKKP